MPRAGGDESALVCAAVRRIRYSLRQPASVHPNVWTKKRERSPILLRAGESGYRNQCRLRPVEVCFEKQGGTIMKRTALALIGAGIVGVTALASPSPAEARWPGGWGPGIAGGLIGTVVIGGLASSAYAYGPGYGYGGYPYYGRLRAGLLRLSPPSCRSPGIRVLRRRLSARYRSSSSLASPLLVSRLELPGPAACLRRPFVGCLFIPKAMVAA